MRMLNSSVRFANVFASMQNRAVVVFNVAACLLHLLHAHQSTLGKSTEGTSPKRFPSSRDWLSAGKGSDWIQMPIPAYATIRRTQSLRRSG